jgi:hypothetical protein
MTLVSSILDKYSVTTQKCHLCVVCRLPSATLNSRAKYHKFNLWNHKTETGKKKLKKFNILLVRSANIFCFCSVWRISLGTFIKPGSEIKSVHHKLLRVAEGSRHTTQRWHFWVDTEYLSRIEETRVIGHEKRDSSKLWCLWSSLPYSYRNSIESIHMIFNTTNYYNYFQWRQKMMSDV